MLEGRSSSEEDLVGFPSLSYMKLSLQCATYVKYFMYIRARFLLPRCNKFTTLALWSAIVSGDTSLLSHNATKTDSRTDERKEIMQTTVKKKSV